MEGLPKWPEATPEYYEGDPNTVALYWIGRSVYWEARCRLAVDVIVSMTKAADAGNAEGAADLADDGLKAIGPLHQVISPPHPAS